MKRTIFFRVFFLLAFTLLGVVANAHDFEVDGIYYNKYGNEATVTYRGTSYSQYSNEYSGDVTIPATVTYNGTTFTVTRIGFYAFYDCTSLTNVDIPNSVTEIYDHAFYDCTSLTNIHIPNSVTKIWNDAFYHCTSLTNISLPNSINDISDFTFYGCTSLTSIIIPNSVTTIGADVFNGCSRLTSVTIPNSVINIGTGAFEFCSSLFNINIPNSVAFIGSVAFYGTPWFNNQPDGLVYAGLVAYKYKGTMPSNTTLVLREGTIGIAGSAFKSCTGLTNITIPNTVARVGRDAFDGTTWYNNQPDGLVYAGLVAYKYKGSMPSGTEVVIKEGTPSISPWAFYDCDGLSSVTIPSSVSCIGNYAFGSCSSLDTLNYNAISCADFFESGYDSPAPGMPFSSCNISTINIGDGVQRIPALFAYKWTRATEIIIPSSVTSIGAQAFYRNANIIAVTCEAETPPSWDENDVFTNDVYYQAPLYVPKDCKNAYMLDPNWGQFFTINVIPIASSISLNNSSLNLYVDDTSQLLATVLPENVQNKRVTWETTNNNIANVDNNGLVTAIAPGTAIITATTTDGTNLSATCFVIVKQPATSISLSQTSATLYMGNSLQLSATVLPYNTSDKSVSWSSSNNNVATVSPEGLVTPVSTGTATITVKTEDGSNLTAQCVVTVRQLATSITLNETDVTICTGNTLQLTATVLPSTTSNKSVTWTSSNPSVVTVSSSGLVTAVSVGNATITVKTADGSNLSASCSVTVIQLATSISLNKTSATLYMGNSLRLTATVLPNNTTDKTVSWSSSNSDVAVVSSDGLVIPVSTGTAIITVKTEDGSNLTAQCVVTVKQLATSISLSETDVTIYTGNTLQLTATVLPSTTSNPAVTWSSSNTSVATVSSTGLVTAKSTGNAVITAKTSDGTNLSATCNVTVKRLATSISLNKTSATLYLDQTLQLTATVSPSNATDKSVVWSSSNNSIATVSSTGLVTAIATGNATITATTADGSDLSATCEITVNAYVTSLTLDQSEVTILEGDTFTLTPTILPSYATNQNIYWSSNNTGVATVSNGVVVGRSGGEATITARTADGTNLYAYCQVKVIPNFDISMPNFSHIRGSANNKFDLKVDLANRYDITGMQFDIQFPDGVNIAKDNNGEYDIWPDDARKTRNHTATASLISNNTYRILVSSATANSLKGHSGTVVHIMIEIPLYHVSGNKQVQYSNIILSEPDETRHTIPTKYSLISYCYKEGDANADVNVDVADYVITGNYILQNGPENFWYDAANVDHNSTIDVNDLTGITNIALGRREGGILQMPAIQQTPEKDIELTAKPLEFQKGQTKTLDICLNESIAFAGFQMDMQLPEGMRLVDASLTDVDSGLSLATAELADGSIRLLASSFSMKNLAVNNSSFLRITLSAEDEIGADGKIMLDDIKFSKRNMELHTAEHYEIPVGNGVSGLEQVYSRIRIYPEGKSIIIDSPESATARIVTIAGISLSHDVHPGHNVIPMDDAGLYIVTLNGTTAKLYLK